MPVKSFARGSFFCVLIFTVLVIVLHVLRPDLNPLSHTVSEYAIGPYGYLMTIAFIARGLGELCLVAGLVLGTIHSGRSWAGLVLLALATVCSLLVAIFPGDIHNTSVLVVHSLGAFVGFVSLAVAAIVWSQRFRKDSYWRSSALASLVLGLLILLSVVGMVIGSANLIGLFERILELCIIGWLCLVALRLSTLASAKGS
jgi:hypothetical protein